MTTNASKSGETSKAATDSSRPSVSLKAAPSTPPDLQLKRFLYLNEPRLSFVTGNPEQHGHFARKSLECIAELLSSEDTQQLFFNILENVSGANLLPRRDNLFYVLALAATSCTLTPELKTRIYRTVPLICESDQEYFSFVRYFTLERKNPPSGLNKSIAQFYLGKEPMQLARDVTETRGYRGWRHADLIKLSHAKTAVKSSSMVLTYALHGLEKAKLEADSSEECQEILELLTDASEYRKTQDENNILQLLPKLNGFSHLQLQPNLHKSFLIWNVIYERLTLQKLLSLLLFFYKNNFFQKDEFLTKITKRLKSAEFIKDSQIHPNHVLIACKEFEKGGKPKDPQLVLFLDEAEEKKRADKKTGPNYVKPNHSHVEPPKCPLLISALYATLALSYANVPSLGKRYVIAIEVSESMNKPCLGCKNITCLEAAVVIALGVHKSEANVVVGVFNGPNLTLVSLEKECSFKSALGKVKEAASGYVAYGQPLDWAATKGKLVDVFICLVHNLIPRRLPKWIVCNPAPALERYLKKKGSSTNTKVILHSLGRASGNYFDSRHSNILNLHGFDESIAPLMSAFVTNKF